MIQNKYWSDKEVIFSCGRAVDMSGLRCLVLRLVLTQREMVGGRVGQRNLALRALRNHTVLESSCDFFDSFRQKTIWNYPWVSEVYVCDVLNPELTISKVVVFEIKGLKLDIHCFQLKVGRQLDALFTHTLEGMSNHSLKHHRSTFHSLVNFLWKHKGISQRYRHIRILASSCWVPAIAGWPRYS